MRHNNNIPLRAVAVAFGLIISLGLAVAANETFTISKATLLDKIKGGWAGQTIGCSLGGPTEFCYRGVMIPDSRELEYPDGMLKNFFEHNGGLYDDIYMDLTFVEVFNKEGLDAPLESFANAFSTAKYPLWHANQLARYNLLRGISPTQSGYWKNNPHADCIDFQIEADFSGLMSPGMPNTASAICDKIGHMLNWGDGWYGGVYVGAMYTQAFICNDIKTVVTNALKVIPEGSKYYRCMSDVIKWHEQYPDDWKKCWQLYNDKYSKDVGCPELILAAGNIDATMNSAYVLMGLLYGNGDFGKTMEIATRCGQDSDCNPSTAAGILATLIGYSNIPEKWMPNLREVENMDFAYTDMSLNTTYSVVYNLAVKNILKQGGQETDSTLVIQTQTPQAVRLEQSFPDMTPKLLASGIEHLGEKNATQNSFTFEGKGFVMHGSVDCTNTLYENKLEVTVDGKVDTIIPLWSDYRHRTDAIYWNYDLAPGRHTISFRVLNPGAGLNIKCDRVFYYISPEDDKPISAIQPTIINNYGDARGVGVAFDFNNDGIQDLFLTGRTIKGNILQGTGDPDPAKAYQKISNIGDIAKINNFASVTPCDINRDGYIDLIAFDSDPTSFGGDDKGQEGIFLGDGTGRFTKADVVIYNQDGDNVITSYDWKLIKAADVADFNNDGLQDIVTTSDRIGYSNVLINAGVDADGKLIFKRNNYSSTINSRSRSKTRDNCAGYVKAYDLNSDGYTDILLFGATNSGKAYYFINNPKRPGHFSTCEFPVYRDLPAFDIADINADGLPEIYYAGEYSSSEGWKNRIYAPVIIGDSVSYRLFCTLPWQNNDINMGWRASAFVDWDGDGTIDLLETGRCDTDINDTLSIDSRATNIRLNMGDGQSWADPILTIGSNANATILVDANNDGVVDYMRNGTNDLAVDIDGLKYSTGTQLSVTLNPNTPAYSPVAPVFNTPVVEDSVVTLSWTMPEGSIGNETFEYAVFNSANTLVAGTNLVDYSTGLRKVVAAGNACGARQVRLSLPNGTYRAVVQSVSGGYKGSSFATTTFEINMPTAVSSATVGAGSLSSDKNNTVFYSIDGKKATNDSHGILISSDGKKILR